MLIRKLFLSMWTRPHCRTLQFSVLRKTLTWADPSTRGSQVFSTLAGLVGLSHRTFCFSVLPQLTTWHSTSSYGAPSLCAKRRRIIMRPLLPCELFPELLRLLLILGECPKFLNCSRLETNKYSSFMLITSMYYTREEQPSRISSWYAFNGLGVAGGGLIGYGIGKPASVSAIGRFFLLTLGH